MTKTKGKRYDHRAEIESRLADEVGTLRSGAAERVALLYPSPYHVGMSSLGFQAIYGVIHDAGYGADRAFLPDDVDAHRLVGKIACISEPMPRRLWPATGSTEGLGASRRGNISETICGVADKRLACGRAEASPMGECRVRFRRGRQGEARRCRRGRRSSAGRRRRYGAGQRSLVDLPARADGAGRGGSGWRG